MKQFKITFCDYLGHSPLDFVVKFPDFPSAVGFIYGIFNSSDLHSVSVRDFDTDNFVSYVREESSEE